MAAVEAGFIAKEFKFTGAELGRCKNFISDFNDLVTSKLMDKGASV
jgi:hypothetical protein